MLTLLIALVTASSASPMLRPRAPEPALLPEGVSNWVGSYTCSQGETHLSLVLTRRGDELFATFAFGPLPENPTVPTGAFQMTGVVEGRSVMLFPGPWLDRPARYVTVGLTGELDPAERALRGVVDTPTGRCLTFEVHPVEPAP